MLIWCGTHTCGPRWRERCERWIFDWHVLWSSVPAWLQTTASTFSPSKNLSVQNLCKNSFSCVYLSKQSYAVCTQHVCVYPTTPPPCCSSTRQLFDSSIKLFPIFRFLGHQNISWVKPPQILSSTASKDKKRAQNSSFLWTITCTGLHGLVKYIYILDKINWKFNNASGPGIKYQFCKTP